MKGENFMKKAKLFFFMFMILMVISVSITFALGIRTGARRKRVKEIETIIENVNPNVDKKADIALLIYKYSQKHEVCYKLVSAIIIQESSFDYKAVGMYGEKGLMQVMPNTAGFIYKDKDYDLFNIENNLDIGIKYLKFTKEVIKHFKSDKNIIKELALTSFNRGHGIVRKNIREGINPRNGYERKVLKRKELIEKSLYKEASKRNL